MRLLLGITVLLCYQLLGEFVVLALEVPVPGPVMGMLFLFLTLLVRGTAPESLDATATTLLSHLSLLFVPAGVGVVVHVHRIGAEWLPITAALVLGTVITLGLTALCMQTLQALLTRGRSHGRD